MDVYEDLDPFFPVEPESGSEGDDETQEVNKISSEALQELETLKEENSQLSAQNAALRKNISCLFKTAKLELGRKDTTIRSLEQRVDVLQALVNHAVQRMKDTPTTTPTVATGNPPPPPNPPPNTSPPSTTVAEDRISCSPSDTLIENIPAQEKPQRRKDSTHQEESRKPLPRECRRDLIRAVQMQQREKDLARKPSNKENVVGRSQAKSSERERGSHHRGTGRGREGGGRQDRAGEGSGLGKRGRSHCAAKLEEGEERRRSGRGVKRLKRNEQEAFKSTRNTEPSRIHLPPLPMNHKIESSPQQDHSAIVTRPPLTPSHSPPPPSSIITDQPTRPASPRTPCLMADTCGREPPTHSEPSLATPNGIEGEKPEKQDMTTCSNGTISPRNVRREELEEPDFITCLTGTAPSPVSVKPPPPEEGSPQQSEKEESTEQKSTVEDPGGRECGMTRDEGGWDGGRKQSMKGCDDSSSLGDVVCLGRVDSQDMVLVMSESVEEDAVTLFPETDLQPGIELPLAEEEEEEEKEDGELSSDDSRPPTPSSSPLKVTQRRERGRKRALDRGKSRAVVRSRHQLRELEMPRDCVHHRTRGRSRERVREIDHRARYPRRPPSPPPPPLRARELRSRGYPLPLPPHKRTHRPSRQC